MNQAVELISEPKQRCLISSISMRKRGLSIIVVSSELQEIVSIADRVLVLSNGLKTGEFSGDEIKEDTLVLASYKGHHVQNHEKEY